MNLLDFIFPKRCVGCGKIGSYICSSCKTLMVPIAPNECICPMCEKLAIAGITHPGCYTRYALDGLTSCFYYKDVVRDAIKTIKYRFVSDLAHEFIDYIPLLSYEIRSLIGNPHMTLVPIPLHQSRYRYRGFNQSQTLGALLAKRLQISISTDILRRRLATVPQVHMKNRSERLSNMRNVFEIRKSTTNQNYTGMLLFDDVFTTGATLREAANILKRSGVKHVWGVTIAR